MSESLEVNASFDGDEHPAKDAMLSVRVKFPEWADVQGAGSDLEVGWDAW